ncbi:bifunctional diaminohydroxyphosphoribosylaminopyrimidine deaminase/5-amino-6-(5-phosphoribosylamino)uracil reductase RibD [Anaerotalea alkaliphila]|uniref:Riboflavin biosynthesis protein RibD n=1 Tax=Anaerotalea alkaliphila TaxID=2662126 RepID=A0A7X5KLE6_9FIRM|nr:bifunctional diaminohydroxyphosphoribosylaminopyrimidine deaminase/5-amino-6-(5-phosphoribosylamino)uracil reductase RibD [Anaerotalea alkaliphila]NDL66619.1 bifunctional diaminohydroxyphosphoribosylaminopyrimidine deaminase/5-amino-6-(5-phosphoribosylamino)uracil reductase RibD [Anaerotalea alkaliphila]
MHMEHMRMALELAAKGAGHTNPNPLVGAVIVKDGRVIGRGYHKRYGGPHAEVEAFASATEDVEGATMYVTLEPCSHYGKTPPCAQAIVAQGIARVVVAMEDPNPLVAGKGLQILKDNGIQVEVGVLEEEARKLNRIFLKYISSKMPYCILKTAMTLDGKIATATGDSKWITNEASRAHVHELRHRVSAIMAGIGTVLADDPSLTTRLDVPEPSHPHRIIVDTCGRIPLDAQVLQDTPGSRRILATTAKAPIKKREQLAALGVEVVVVPEKDGQVDLPHLFAWLGEEKIDSILLEGGGNLNFSVLKEGLVDRVVAFVAPLLLGGRDAKTPVEGAGFPHVREGIRLDDMEVHPSGGDLRIEAVPRKGQVGNVYRID